MEGNKDEAEKCVRIALASIRVGDKAKALKFLNKANKLYPTERASELIDQLNHSQSGASSCDMNDGSSAAGPDKEAERQQRKKEDSSKHEHTYTQEQYALVTKVLKCKDFYQVLDVAKDCTEDDLKKAYRKLALKLHPDKNHAPGATEAFKAVGKAWATLSDTEKRKRYDMFGNEAEEASGSSPRHRHYHQRNGFYYYDDDDEISPEEIFNMFFGGAFPTNNVRRRYTYQSGHRHNPFHTHQQTTQQDEAVLERPMAVQLLPLIMMLVVMIVGHMFSADPTFQYMRDAKYTNLRYTKSLQIPYYVKPDFLTEYQGSVRQIEQQVEDQYVSNLRNQCFKERSYKENLLWRARSYGDAKMYEKAQATKTPACDKLQSLYNR